MLKDLGILTGDLMSNWARNSGRNASASIMSLSISRWLSWWNSEMLPSSWLRRSRMSLAFSGTVLRAVGLILISQISCGTFSVPTLRGRISSSTGGLSENSPSQ